MVTDYQRHPFQVVLYYQRIQLQVLHLCLWVQMDLVQAVEFLVCSARLRVDHHYQAAAHDQDDEALEQQD